MVLKPPKLKKGEKPAQGDLLAGAPPEFTALFGTSKKEEEKKEEQDDGLPRSVMLRTGAMQVVSIANLVSTESCRFDHAAMNSPTRSL